MDASEYKAMYDKALKELSRLMETREQLELQMELLESRIAEVRAGAKALAPLCRQDPYETHAELFPEIDHPMADPIGLTEAIRTILQAANPMYLTAVGVRAGLEAAGYEIKSKNILPSIHTILKRLDGKEVMSKVEEGRAFYRWNAPARKSKPDWVRHVDFSQMVADYAYLVESNRKKGGKEANALKDLVLKSADEKK